MKTLYLKKLVVATGVVFACTAGYTQAAGLGANFSVDQSPVSVGGVLTDIDSMNFRYSATINQQQTGGTFLDGDDHFNESGFMSFSAYQDDAGVAIGGSALNFDYKIYSVFTADGTSGVDGSGGIFANFDSFKLKFYVDDAANTTFNLSGDGIAATTTNNAGDDKLLATASILDVGQAHVFGGLANGDFQIDMTDFGLELFGKSFFIDPNPFYNKFFFTGVTTDITGADSTKAFIANATGSGDLAFKGVPEPASVILFGVGLLGLGVASSKRRI